MTEFNPENHGIRKDKFDYIIKMLEECGVTISVEHTSSNPDLIIAELQQYEDDMVESINDIFTGLKVIPRRMTMDTYKHQVVSFISNGVAHKISCSTPLMGYNAEGKLTQHPTIVAEDSVPEEFLGIYLLAALLRHAVAFWKDFVADDIYTWAEKRGCADSLNDEGSYLYNAFDYQKEIVGTLIAVFGHDRIEQAVNDLVDNSCCGE